jgi:hypothetical protein
MFGKVPKNGFVSGRRNICERRNFRSYNCVQVRRRVDMLTRSTLIGIILVAVVPLAAAKNKQVLPSYGLQAQTVAALTPASR